MKSSFLGENLLLDTRHLKFTQCKPGVLVQVNQDSFQLPR
uniref:Uncharacterized protein n=1 Tax=Arundo donax TaxID=35708 RepID=A0A0A9BFH6_ARUDO